jgi:hypothetical protein
VFGCVEQYTSAETFLFFHVKAAHRTVMWCNCWPYPSKRERLGHLFISHYLKKCADPHMSITINDRVNGKDLIITFDLETEKWGPYMHGPPISFPDDAPSEFQGPWSSTYKTN